MKWFRKRRALVASAVACLFLILGFCITYSHLFARHLAIMLLHYPIEDEYNRSAGLEILKPSVAQLIASKKNSAGLYSLSEVKLEGDQIVYSFNLKSDVSWLGRVLHFNKMTLRRQVQKNPKLESESEVVLYSE